TLEPGGFLVILGPNGAGKTTLLRVLARLLRPDRGRVLIDGEDWLAAPPVRQREVGLATHATFLYDGLTARENLAFYGELYGIADPSSAATEALSSMRLEHVADRRAGSLSRGEAQRLAIARALLHTPRLLLLDEPFAGLDPATSRVLGDLLSSLHAAGRTVVLTTHDLARAPAAATRCLVLDNGRVRAEGSWEEMSAIGLEEAYVRALSGDGWRTGIDQ
ncbi:MAG: heme ABC exporter ATP-binding protein CcmA, partial [Gemmatimonadota bacterium]